MFIILYIFKFKCTFIHLRTTLIVRITTEIAGTNELITIILNDQNHDGTVEWNYKVAEFGIQQISSQESQTRNAMFTPKLRELPFKICVGYVNLTWKEPLKKGSPKIDNYRIYRNETLVPIVSVTQL